MVMTMIKNTEGTLPVKIPVAAGGLTADEFYAEVKRGYDDCAIGRTRPTEEVFRDIEAGLENV